MQLTNKKNTTSYEIDHCGGGVWGEGGGAVWVVENGISNTLRFKGFKFVHLERNGSKVYITVFR